MSTVYERSDVTSSDDVEGTNVYNPGGDKLGSIDDLMIDKVSTEKLARDAQPTSRAEADELSKAEAEGVARSRSSSTRGPAGESNKPLPRTRPVK